MLKPAPLRSCRPWLSMYFSMPAMPTLSTLAKPSTCAAAGAVRVDALVLGQEADARDAEAVHLGLLARRDLALDPDEALLRAELLAQLARVEIRQHGGEELDRLVLVDDVARLGEDRDHLDVGRQHLAVAVDDVGPRRRDLGRRGAAELAAACRSSPRASRGARRSRRTGPRSRARRGRRGRCSCRRAAGTARARRAETRMRSAALAVLGGAEARSDHGAHRFGVWVEGVRASPRPCPSASRSARAGRAARACGRSRPGACGRSGRSDRRASC